MISATGNGNERGTTLKAEARILDYDSTLEGERVGMTIDEGALAHIMAVLTDLYSDPEMAVLREYSTNALDAHTEAGQRRPIEVTLPSQLTPFLKVRDYGTGLDAEGIRTIYSRYGTSTKRDSNDVVGMLGLGCKSALTYADQFTLIGVKDGRRVQVLVSRDEDGSGSMTIVDDSATADVSGVEVVIPAKRVNDFADKAASFFRYWQAGTVLVNGVQPERIDGLWLAPDLLLTDEVDGNVAVMGNVAYPFTDAVSYGGWRQPRLVAFVPIGALTFTPSRESLQATKRTNETLQAIVKRVDAELSAAVIKQCAEAATATEAQAALRQGQAAGFKGQAIWQGHVVQLQLDRQPAKPSSAGAGYWRAPDPADSPDKSFLRVGQQYGRRKGERTWQVPTDPALHWFVGYDSREMTPTKREKLQVWAEGRGLTVNATVMVSQLTTTERVWLDPASVHDWADVDAVKLTKQAHGACEDGRPRGSYDCLVAGHWQTVQAADLDLTMPLYWLHGSQGNVSAHPGMRAGFLSSDSCTIVALPGNRVEKFCRDFPTAVELDNAVREVGQAKLDALDPAEVESYRVALGSDLAALRGLDPARFTDPALQLACQHANANTDNVATLARDCRHWLDLAGLAAKRVAWSAGYPLLASSYSLAKHPDHAYLYANAVHASALVAADKGQA